eukprot:2583157-Amphidinium_carterae.1
MAPSPEGARACQHPAEEAGLWQPLPHVTQPRHVPPVLGRKGGYVHAPPFPAPQRAHAVALEVYGAVTGAVDWAPAPTCHPSL